MKRIWLVFTLLVQTAFLFAQNVSLDNALKEAASFVSSKLPVNTKIVVLNFDTDDNKELSGYIIDELTMYLVNEGKVIVVDRANLALIQQEINFQLSGEVSDESAQAIGKKLGAETIVSGIITRLGDYYRFRVRLLSVETAQVQGIQPFNIAVDDTLAALLGAALSPNMAPVFQAPAAPVPVPAGSPRRNTTRVPYTNSEVATFSTSQSPGQFITNAIQVSRDYFKRYDPRVVAQDGTSAIIMANFGRYDVEIAITADALPYQIEIGSTIRDRDYVVKWIRNIETRMKKFL
jgi:TolB-like protein